MIVWAIIGRSSTPTNDSRKVREAHQFGWVAWLEWLWFILGCLWVFYWGQGAIMPVRVLIKQILRVRVQLECPSFDQLLVLLMLLLCMRCAKLSYH